MVCAAFLVGEVEGSVCVCGGGGGVVGGENQINVLILLGLTRTPYRVRSEGVKVDRFKASP